MAYLISFSGIDGAGKSTQVKLLLEYLRDKGQKVHATESMFGYFLLKPLVRVLRKTTGSSSGGPVVRNKSFLPKVWFIFAFIDIWIAYIFKIQPLLKKYDYVIADRFYTDIWANLLYYGYLPTWAFNFFITLLPKPYKLLWMSINPKSVSKREQEFPTAYYVEQEKIYKNMANRLDFYVINADQEPKDVFREIKNALG